MEGRKTLMGSLMAIVREKIRGELWYARDELPSGLLVAWDIGTVDLQRLLHHA